MSGIFNKFFVKSEPVYDISSNKLIDNLKSFWLMTTTSNKSPKELGPIDSEVRDFFAIKTKESKSLNNDKIIFSDKVNINMVPAV